MKYLLILICFISTSPGYSQVVGRVFEVQGNAFLFKDKKILPLKYGSKIFDFSEVMVEDGAVISIINSDDHVFHLSGSSLVKFNKGIVELKKGSLWVKSQNKSRGLMSTPNSLGEYSEGEFIYSFDNVRGKTQLLVLTGEVKFSNAITPQLFTRVVSGYFSFVDKAYENGLPRTPTKVGLNSYKRVKGSFSVLKSIQNSTFEKTMWGERETLPKRSIASVNTSDKSKPESSTGLRRGKITYMTTYAQGRKPASTNGGAAQYYSDFKKSEAWKYKPLQSKKEATLRYFGRDVKSKKLKKLEPSSLGKRKRVEKSSRAPASIQKMKLIKELSKSNFEKSLSSESLKIKRHDNEVNSLIDELKTYKKDFKKEY